MRRRQGIAPLHAPKPPGIAVVHIKDQPPVRQLVVAQRVPRRAPLAKHQQIGRQGIEQGVGMGLQPCVQPGELTGVGRMQVLSTVLQVQVAGGVE